LVLWAAALGPEQQSARRGPDPRRLNGRPYRRAESAPGGDGTGRVHGTFVGVEPDRRPGRQNHITISFPLATLNAEIAAAAPSSGPVPTIDSASADVWIYKATSQLAKIEIKGASSTLGNLDFVVTITNYNAPVTKRAAASDINPATS